MADDFEPDPVMVEKIEAAAGIVIAMVTGPEPGGFHATFDRVEVDAAAELAGRRALCVALRFGKRRAGRVAL